MHDRLSAYRQKRDAWDGGRITGVRLNWALWLPIPKSCLPSRPPVPSILRPVRCNHVLPVRSYHILLVHCNHVLPVRCITHCQCTVITHCHTTLPVRCHHTLPVHCKHTLPSHSQCAVITHCQAPGPPPLQEAPTNLTGAVSECIKQANAL